MQKSLFYDRFQMYKANSFNNNNQQVTDAAGPRLPTNAVSLMQRAFGSDCILGTTSLVLSSGFNIYMPVKRYLHLHSHSNGCRS